MKRLSFLGFCLAIVASLCTVPAHAQENRYEIQLGATFPLVSRTFEVDTGTGYQLSFGIRVEEHLTLGLVYDTRTVVDDLGSDYDVDVNLYGVRAVWRLSGSSEFHLLGITSIGIGEVVWANEGPSDPAYPNDTDIDFWYEIGGGAEFGWGEHWTARLLATVRGLHPKDPTRIIPGSRSEFVPTLSFGFSF